MTIARLLRPRCSHASRPLLFALLATVVAFGLGAPATASADPWITDDIDSAIKKARAEGKYLLIDITGSDWCGWCIRLDEEVFDQSAFQREATKHFVLAKLDFPRRKSQPERVKAINNEWRQRLGVKGYPSIYLANANGEPFAKTGYKAGGPQAYLTHLDTFLSKRRQQETLIAKAREVEGVERATLLGQALEVTGIQTPEKNLILHEIKSADPEDTLGLIKKHGEPKGDRPDPRTPFERDLEALRQMLETGEVNDVLRAVRTVERQHRPKGTELADLILVQMEAFVAGNRAEAAIRAAKRYMRIRDMPVAGQQKLGQGLAEALLADGQPDAAREAWQAAIDVDPTSDFGRLLEAQRGQFEARCRNADPAPTE